MKTWGPIEGGIIFGALALNLAGVALHLYEGRYVEMAVALMGLGVVTMAAAYRGIERRLRALEAQTVMRLDIRFGEPKPPEPRH